MPINNRCKKIWYEDIIDRQALKSGVGIEDYPQYGRTRATTEEIHMQHSYAMERYMKEREQPQEGVDKENDKEAWQKGALVIQYLQEPERGYRMMIIFAIKSTSASKYWLTKLQIWIKSIMLSPPSGL